MNRKDYVQTETYFHTHHLMNWNNEVQLHHLVCSNMCTLVCDEVEWICPVNSNVMKESFMHRQNQGQDTN